MVAPDPVAFTLFGIDVMWYGVLIGSGMILGTLIAYKRAPGFRIERDHLLDCVIWGISLGVVCARLYYVIFRWEYYGGDVQRILDIRGGGLAIHGGIIGGILAIIIVCRLDGLRLSDVLDLLAPSLALAQSIGRWGNFFNEEAHGGPTDLPINVLIDGETYHATFLYESVWCFLLFLLLLFISGRRSFSGQVALIYMILYSTERFFVESLRTDSLMIGPFRQAQVISCVIVAASVFLYIRLSKLSGRRVRTYEIYRFK